MKGMVFCGCSFTWGQGLYYYSKLPTLVEPPEYTFDWDLVTEAHRKYMFANRWARLVANHFKTFEVVKNSNGGQEAQSLEFLETIFQNTDKSPSLNSNPFYSTEKYDYSEIDYIILQTSIPVRNPLRFELDGKKYSYELGRKEPRIQDLLYRFAIENNLENINSLEKILIEQQFNDLLNAFEFYESKGIKCRILCWQDQYLGSIKANEFMSKRFIDLTYANKTYETINRLGNDNENMWVMNDYEFFGENPPKDHHPSMKCHEVIAASIINKIESEL